MRTDFSHFQVSPHQPSDTWSQRLMGKRRSTQKPKWVGQVAKWRILGWGRLGCGGAPRSLLRGTGCRGRQGWAFEIFAKLWINGPVRALPERFCERYLEDLEGVFPKPGEEGSRLDLRNEDPASCESPPVGVGEGLHRVFADQASALVTAAQEAEHRAVEDDPDPSHRGKEAV